MIRRFCDDVRANYAIATAVALVPLMGGVAIAVDYSEMTREKQAVMNALDAAGIATAREIVSGATDAQLLQYAQDFFEANLGPVDPADTDLEVFLPSAQSGGGKLILTAELTYQPKFFPAFARLAGTVEDGGSTDIKILREVGNPSEEHARGGARPR